MFRSKLFKLNLQELPPNTSPSFKSLTKTFLFWKGIIMFWFENLKKLLSAKTSTKEEMFEAVLLIYTPT